MGDMQKKDYDGSTALDSITYEKFCQVLAYDTRYNDKTLRPQIVLDMNLSHINNIEEAKDYYIKTVTKPTILKRIKYLRGLLAIEEMPDDKMIIDRFMDLYEDKRATIKDKAFVLSELIKLREVSRESKADGNLTVSFTFQDGQTTGKLPEVNITKDAKEVE